MVQQKDFLKPISAMAEDERSAYFENVQRWTEEEYPRLEAVVDAWTESEYKVFDEGLKLCSAMARAKQFVGLAYRLNIERRMREIKGFMSAILAQTGVRKSTCPRIGQNPKPVVLVGKAPKAQLDEDGVERVVDAKAPLPDRRPRHYDDWMDRMSAGLREKVNELSSLYAAMAHYRQMVENLAADPRHSEQDLSRAARLAVEYEKKILSVHRQADIEWAELKGRKVSDDVKREALSDEQAAALQVKRLEAIASNGASFNTEGGVPDTVFEDDVEHYSRMTLQELSQAEELTDGMRRYYYERRKKNVRDYVRNVRISKEKRMEYLAEYLGAGYSVTPKMREVLEKDGIDFKKMKNGTEHP